MTILFLKISINNFLLSTTLDDGDNKDEYANVVIGGDEIAVCSCRLSCRWTNKRWIIEDELRNHD